MFCISCNMEIPFEFAAAIQKNECPACGKSIIDDESLALMDELRESISKELKLREESITKLVFMLISKYNISFRDKSNIKSKARVASKKNILTERDFSNDCPISEEERQKIMEERVAERYKMANQVSVEEINKKANPALKQMKLSPELENLKNVVSDQLIGDNELVGNPILEQKQALRLARQESNMASGKFVINRS